MPDEPIGATKGTRTKTVGGELVLADALKAGQPLRISELARQYVAIVAAVRAPVPAPAKR